MLFFRDILGQERVWRALGTALQRGRLAHAYLFLGPEGVGKESVARALAAALNCQEPREDGDACGVCPPCRRLAAGTHADFLIIAPSSEGRQPQIKIEQIREFRRLTAYPAVEGGWRVVLIKPAEALNEASLNALLKTLEEPPPQHLLILTARVEADLSTTLVSRCHRLAFSPLGNDLIMGQLLGRGLSRPQALLVTALSGGSLGRALSFNPDDLLEQRRQVLTDLAQLPAAPAGQVLDWAVRLAKNNPGLENFLLLAQLWYRDLLLLHNGVAPHLLANQDLLPELMRQQRQSPAHTWFAGFAALAAAHRHLRANLNVELTLDVLGFHLQQPGAWYDSR